MKTSRGNLHILRIVLIKCEKFPIGTRPAWELRKPYHFVRTAPSSGTYIGWDDGMGFGRNVDSLSIFNTLSIELEILN